MNHLTLAKQYELDTTTNPFQQNIALLSTYVSQMDKTKDLWELMENLTVDVELSLVREANNPINEHAIKVLYNQQPIGYIPFFQDTILANLMDAGKELYATVYSNNIESLKISTQYEALDGFCLEITIFLKD